MNRCFFPALAATLLIGAVSTPAADWPAFRGPDRDGKTDETKAPLTWSADKNIKWKVALPSRRQQQPDRLRRRVFLACRREPAGHPPQPLLLQPRRRQDALGEDRRLRASTNRRTPPTPTAAPPPPPTASTSSSGTGRPASSATTTMANRTLVARPRPLPPHLGLRLLARHLRRLGPPQLRPRRTQLRHRPGPRDRQDDLADRRARRRRRPQPRDQKLARLLGHARHRQGRRPRPDPRRPSPPGESLRPRRPARSSGPAPAPATSPTRRHGRQRRQRRPGVAMAGYGGKAIGFKLGGAGDVTADQPPLANHRQAPAAHRHRRHRRPPPLHGQRARLLLLSKSPPARNSGSTTSRPRSFWAASSAAADRLYATSQKGTTYVFAPDPTAFKLLATNELGEGTNSTLAISEGRSFSGRSSTCIASPRGDRRGPSFSKTQINQDAPQAHGACLRAFPFREKHKKEPTEASSAGLAHPPGFRSVRPRGPPQPRARYPQMQPKSAA